MSKERKFIPVEEAFADWRKDPEFVKEYEALEDEFALASALIDARANANLTQIGRASCRERVFRTV